MKVRPSSIRFVILGCAVFGLASLGATCGGTGGRVVNVTLREFTVTPDVDAVPAGMVTFHVTNAGQVDHEFLVVKTDFAPDALPTDADGRFDEQAPGAAVLDEIELIRPGQSANLTLTLDAGSHVLVCNKEAHYSEGMYTGFTATP
jgi:uncharacterized cupredoxin-like copper-binding protein